MRKRLGNTQRSGCGGLAMAHRIASLLAVAVLVLVFSTLHSAPVDPVPTPQPLEDRPRPKADADGRVKGTLKSFDEETLVLTVTVDGHDYSYQLPSDVTVLTATGRPYAETSKFRILGRLRTNVAIKLETRDGREIVTEIQVNPRRPRDPNPANPPPVRGQPPPPPIPVPPPPGDLDRKDD